LRGRRVRKGVYVTPNVVTKYCYDGDQVIAEYDYNSTIGDYELARKFVYGPGIDEPVCMIDVAAGNKIYYYHYDGLGSVVALSDVNSEVVEMYEYDVFGRATIWDAATLDIVAESTVGNPYMFTGRRLDAETGLYYYRFRYYDPYTGRFLQTDPIGYVGGLNLYQYCFNNPVNWLDPFGLTAESESGTSPTEGSEKTDKPTEDEKEPQIPIPEMPEEPGFWDKFKDWMKNLLKREVNKRDPLKNYKKGLEEGGKDWGKGWEEGLSGRDLSKEDMDRPWDVYRGTNPRAGKALKKAAKGAGKDVGEYIIKEVKKKSRE